MTPESRYCPDSREEYKQKLRHQFSGFMKKKDMVEVNKKMLEETNKVLDPRVDWLNMYPHEVKGAIRRAKRTITAPQLVELLTRCGGNVTKAATMLNVDRKTVITWLEKDGNSDKLEEINEMWNDRAEEVLNKKIVVDENLQAVMFRLKTKAKHRGYYEKQEKEVNQTIKVSIEAEPPPVGPNTIDITATDVDGNPTPGGEDDVPNSWKQ